MPVDAPVTRPRFTEDWFGTGKKKRLHEALKLIPPGPGLVIEVGSWEGKSTIEIANAVWPENVQVIDHWKGDLTNLANGVAAKAAARDVFADFKANMDAATQGNYVVHRMGWREFPWREPVKFCFIDGQHTYDEVSDNIAAVLSVLVPRGVIAGDDLNERQRGDSARRPVFEAVRDTLGEFDHVERPAVGSAVWWWVRPDSWR